VRLIGENVVLEWEEGAPGIDEVDAGEAVLLGDFLGAEVFLHGDRVVGAALHGGVVGDDDAFAPVDDADAGDDAGAGDVVFVDAGGGERAQFEEGGRRVDEALDAFAGEELAAFAVAGDVIGAAGFGDPVQPVAEVLGEGEVACPVGLVLRVAEVDAGGELGDIVPALWRSLRRGERKEERGEMKRKEERGKRKEERDKSALWTHGRGGGVAAASSFARELRPFGSRDG
jgi:hypothetical protein